MALALVWSTLGGCVHYTPRPITASGNVTAIESRALDAPELAEHLRALGRAGEWPPASWGLDALTLAAFYYHPDLEVARAIRTRAEAGRISAGERPNPNLGLAPGYNSTTPVDQVSPWILTLDFDFTIETAHKRRYRVAQARELSEAARFGIASTAWTVRSRLRSRLLTLWSVTATESLLERQEALQADTVSLLERQLDAGEISPFELTQARIALQEIQLGRLDARRDRDRARVELAAAIGVTVRALDAVALSFDAFERPAPEVDAAAVQYQAVVNRPDVLGALQEYAASQSALQLAVARQYPDLHLGPGYQLDQTDNKWTLLLGGLLPIFHRNRGAIAEAEAARAEAAARFTAVESRAIEELELALVAYRAARERAAAVDTLVSEVRSRERALVTRFESGDISRLELTTVRVELLAAEIRHLEALTGVQAALGSLEDAMQSPTDLAAWLPDDAQGASMPQEERP